MQNIADVYRVSPRQQDLLAAPGGPGVGQVAWTARRMADPGTLARAFRLVVARHPTLRTAVFTEGMPEPLQAVRGEVPLHWEEHDWTALPEAERPARLAELAAAERARPFDAAAAPLMRVAAVRLGEDEHRFVWSWSELVLDPRSATLALEEVLEAYRSLRAGAEPAAPKPAPYRGYVAWLERQDAAAAQAFWSGRVAAADPAPAGGEPRFRVQQIHLPMAETERLGAALQQHRLGWGAVAAGCWAILLHARSGAAEPGFGWGVIGRPPGLAGGDAMLGGFAAVLPLRLPVAADEELVPWLRSVQRAQDALRPFEHASLGQLRAWAGCPAGAPLFDSALEVRTAEDADPLVRLFGSLAFGEVERHDPAGGFPLEVRVTAGQEVAVRVRHDERAASPVEVAALLADFRALLDAVGADPGRRVGHLLAELARRPRADASARGDAALVEAVLAQNPALAGVVVEEAAGGLRARVRGRPEARERDERRKRLTFSLFYFADASGDDAEDKYRIYLDGGRFADRHGFEAVWAPERHFHENGGLYPNPSVLSAALAPLTTRVGLRAGSVALPLHHPLRVAEEWSVVDNLSKGRVGISVTSGWIPNDFALAPQNFPAKREVMFRMIEEVRTLWRGGTLAATDGAGKEVQLR
ncbi:MAG TPA: LLM class flavin-dependent oxidoreductase, partial [Longimicrobiaceae bacterium]